MAVEFQNHWARILAFALLLPLAVTVLLRWFERSQVYQPSRDAWMSPAALGRPVEDFFLATADGGRVHAWFFPAAAGSPRAPLAVLFCHGNGGNLTHRGDEYAALLQTGVNLLAFDYRGYGRSPGRPDEAGTYADAEAALAWLRQRGFPPERVVLWGESLGGGIATEVAARHPAAGLALHGCFTSIPDVGAELFPLLPVRWIARIQYDNRAKLPRVRCPVLVLHSRVDEIIPFHHAERNFAAAREPKIFQELPGGHNDALDAARAEYVAGMEKLLRQIEARSASVGGGKPTS